MGMQGSPLLRVAPTPSRLAAYQEGYLPSNHHRDFRKIPGSQPKTNARCKHRAQLIESISHSPTCRMIFCSSTDCVKLILWARWTELLPGSRSWACHHSASLTGRARQWNCQSQPEAKQEGRALGLQVVVIDL